MGRERREREMGGGLEVEGKETEVGGG